LTLRNMPDAPEVVCDVLTATVRGADPRVCVLPNIRAVRKAPGPVLPSWPRHVNKGKANAVGGSPCELSSCRVGGTWL
jgi:hypothetical protein